MVDTQQIRDEFVARLNEALDDVPGVRKERGRNVDLHKLLVQAGFDKSKQATHKWLNAEAMPEKDNMRMLAGICGVRAEWLEYGDGPKFADRKDSNASPSQEQQTRVAVGQALFAQATPRSRAVINRIVSLEAEGRLSDDDLETLERIIERFSATR